MLKIKDYYAAGGRNTPVSNLQNAHKNIRNKLNKQLSLEKELKEYLKILNNISYNQDDYIKEFKKAGENGINKAIKKRYDLMRKIGNHLANRNLNVNLDLSKDYTYVIEDSIKRTQNTLKSKSKTKTGEMTKKTFQKYFEKWTEIKNNILNDASQMKALDKIKVNKGLLNLKDFANQIDNYVKDLNKDYEIDINDNSYQITKNSPDRIKEIGRSLVFWVNYLSTLPPKTQESGDIAEVFAELAVEIKKDGIQAALEKGTKDIKKNFKKIWTGTKRTGNSKNIMDIRIDFNKGFGLNDNKVMGNKNFNFNEEFTVDGFTYKFNVDYKLDSNRQIKTDIVISDNIKASIKNWNNFGTYTDKSGNKKYQNLGSTYLLNALHRTLNNDNTLEEYIYTLQDNNVKPSDAGAYAVKTAHDIARLSLFVDIAIGYSQKQDASNYLIVNDRSKREWVGIDLYQLIGDSLNKSSSSKTGYKLFLEDFHEDDLSSGAWTVMKRLMKMNKSSKRSKEVKITDSSNLYKSMVFQRLHKDKITAAIKKV